MAVAFSPDDLVLLGYEDIKELDVGDLAIALIGKAKAGIVQSEHAFVYLKTDATREDISRIARRLDGRTLYVLRSQSGPTDTVIKSAFGRDVTVYRIDELLWAHVHELFKSYADNIAASIPSEPNFIAPRGEDLLPKDRLDTFLVEYFTKKRSSNHHKGLVVLKADAGVGKTTLCRQLVKEFAKKIKTHRVVPVYVEASHWGASVTSKSGLWDIIQLSLQNYDAGSGISRSLFEAALRRGLILFVLDGFDELSSSPRSNLSASEIIEGLTALTEDSEAQIVLTTRTPFWNAEVKEDPSQAYSLKLLPFNPQQAKAYIRLFFESDDAKFETARQVYSAVIEHANSPADKGGARAHFWSLPIAVSMICEAVKAGVSLSDWKKFTLEGLLTALCERETKRQDLSLSGDKQLSVFKEVALLEASSEIASFELDDLLAAGVSSTDASKFESHPLLRVRSFRSYTFAYDFVAPFLRALAIREEIYSTEMGIRRSILDAMQAEENGKGFQSGHLARLMANKDVDAVYRFMTKLPTEEMAARAFLLHLLQEMADCQDDVVDAKDRAGIIVKALTGASDGVIRDARFTGAFERLDFSNYEFQRCEFHDIIFKNVNFSGCAFKACKFDGEIQFLFWADSENFARATLDSSCEIRPAARLSLESVLQNDPNERKELIRDLMEAGLSKFWHNGRFKATIRKVDWKKGALGRSRSSDPLLSVFRKCGLISEIAISGVSEGGWIFDRGAIGDLQSFMDHRQLTGQLQVAFDELSKIID